MRYLPSKSVLTFLSLILLLLLLALLATLQYSWLGQISRIESERLKSRLQSNVKRFADEFNAEIKKAYLIFQVDSRVWENPAVATERYKLWTRQGTVPEMIRKIYFARETAQSGAELREFNLSSGTIVTAAWTSEISVLRERLRIGNEGKPSFDSVADDVPALIIPILQNREKTTSVFNERLSADSSFIAPDNFAIVVLDREVIRTAVIPKLAEQYLTIEGDVSYDFSVVNRSDPRDVIFESRKNLDFSRSDANINFFELKLELNTPYINGSENAVLKEQGVTVMTKRRILENTSATSSSPPSAVAEKEGVDAGSQSLQTSKHARIYRADKSGGRWLLNVQHSEGSLDNFIGRTRWKNLAISFGVLILLGASAVLLIAATHRARSTARQQMDFVSSVSHEFRTPVSVICSAGQNLAEGFVKDPKQMRKYGKIIYHEGLRLTEMIEHILEFAGARSGRKEYDFQPVDLPALLENVLMDSKYLLEEKNIKVESKIEENLPLAWADRESLQQSLRNLISNAVKYNNNNGWIGISINADNVYVSILVADKGMEIDSEEMDRIFEPFFRGARAVAEQIKGNGLGLSLIKQTVDAHKGKIRVESKPFEGSRFIIRIPVFSGKPMLGNES